MSPIATTRSGAASARLIQKRRLMSVSSGLSGASALSTLTGSSAIPQLGQSPGSGSTTSGCIGHVYFVTVETALTGSRAMPHCPQSAGPTLVSSGCMGQTCGTPSAAGSGARGVV